MPEVSYIWPSSTWRNCTCSLQVLYGGLAKIGPSIAVSNPLMVVALRTMGLIIKLIAVTRVVMAIREYTNICG